MLDRHTDSILEDSEEAPPPRDPFFYPFRVPRNDNVKAILADVLNQLAGYEKYFRLRQRRRRAADQETYEQLVCAIVCDLIHCYLVDQDRGIAVSLSKRVLGHASRYTGLASSTTLPDVLKRMAAPEMAFVEVAKGEKGNPFLAGRMTTLRPGEKLLTRIDKYSVELSDLTEDLAQETIILKRTKFDHWDRGDRVEYKDTEQTRRLRAEMRVINEWLANAVIECDPFASDTDTYIDDRDRLLRRYYNNGVFSDGGRLFGGFWQPLKEEQRHRCITINRERVATLDFGQMVVRILYGMARAEPPAGDAYDIPGFSRHRDGVKKVFAAMTFVKGDLKARPKGTAKLLPRHGTIHDVTKAIKKHHSPIAHLLGDLVGHRVFARESDILVDLLLVLREQQIVALPIHDAVVVPHTAVTATKSAMEAISKRHLGFVVPVSVTDNTTVQHGREPCVGGTP